MWSRRWGGGRDNWDPKIEKVESLHSMRQDALVKENKYCQVVSSCEEVKKRTPARSAQSERGIVTREGGVGEMEGVCPRSGAQRQRKPAEVNDL